MKEEKKDAAIVNEKGGMKNIYGIIQKIEPFLIFPFSYFVCRMAMMENTALFLIGHEKGKILLYLIIKYKQWQTMHTELSFLQNGGKDYLHTKIIK